MKYCAALYYFAFPNYHAGHNTDTGFFAQSQGLSSHSLNHLLLFVRPLTLGPAAWSTSVGLHSIITKYI